MSEAEDENKIQVKFRTFQKEYAVPDTELSVPISIDNSGLEKLIRGLLTESYERGSKEDLERVHFQFVLLNDFVRGSLRDALGSRDDVSVGETVFEIEYFESNEAPEPRKSSNHDDWVAGVCCAASSAKASYVLSACYDGSVTIWDKDSGEKKLVIPAHTGPAKDVKWIDLDDELGTFVSTSHDQTLLLYRWNVKENSIETLNACKGHERSVDCVNVDPSKKFIVSGSFDNNFKIWGASVQSRSDPDAEDENEGETEGKMVKNGWKPRKKPVTRTPIKTISGHKEGVSGVSFTDNGADEVVTASWDHTLKIWDTEIGGVKHEFVGNKSFFGLSWSPVNRTIITCSADRFIRLYDPRSSEGSIVKSTFTSHKGWVTCVDWNKEKEYYFISGAHDNVVKMWDSRSCKTPLYDLTGHSDRVLCCDWSDLSTIVSGGADNDMKVFKSNVSK